MKWIVSANSNSCRIYAYHGRLHKLELIREINHPENKLKDSELVAANKGHFRSIDSFHGAYEYHTDPVAVNYDHFARELALELNAGREKNLYDSLVFVMPSHMEGLVHKHLNKEVTPMIKHVLLKNLVFLSEEGLLDYINKHILCV